MKNSGSPPEISGPYAADIRDIASRLLECDIVTANQCDCKQFNGNLYNDKHAEYYSTVRDACLYYTWHKIMGTKYWSVHLNGRHIIHIHSIEITKPTVCRECKRREALT